MKAKIITLLIVASALTFPASATNLPSRTFREVIGAYITAHVYSDVKSYLEVTDEEADLTMPRGSELLRQGRFQLVEQLKSTRGTVQVCEPSYTIVAESPAVVIARVDFSYAFCQQQHVLIMEKEGAEQWKIKKIYKLISGAPREGAGQLNANNGIK
jgi:hypothetical protein